MDQYEADIWRELKRLKDDEGYCAFCDGECKHEKPLDFYVEVKTKEGAIGVILGRAQHDDGTWGYSVLIHGDDHSCYDLHHSSLEPTGKQFQRSDFYSGKSITVVVDEDGNGTIKE